MSLPKQVFIELVSENYPIKHDWGKRLFDIIFSSAALLLGSPIYLAIALAIRLTSKGPIFYFQERISRGGKPFKFLKFRTMYTNADEVLKDLLKKNPIMKEEWLKFCKLKNDPRITSVGKFLRRTSLDELPQFWNVLKGDLSVVGPRPIVLQDVIDYFGPRAAKILSIRPGVTGLWQVSGRSNLSMEERVSLEESYIDNRSFFQDIFLIIKTIPVILFSRGAY